MDEAKHRQGIASGATFIGIQRWGLSIHTSKRRANCRGLTPTPFSRAHLASSWRLSRCIPRRLLDDSIMPHCNILQRAAAYSHLIVKLIYLSEISRKKQTKR
jgi:hypothetical protein